MQRTPIAAAAAFTAALIAGLSATACNRNEETPVPAAEIQTTQPAQQSNQPVTVGGCLRAGEAADTFVLTASEPSQATDTATYQLVGNPSVDLRSHVGQRVEVSGVVRQQQEVATRTAPAPAGERETGTSGTPKVETSTKVAFKQLDVSGLKPLGESCDR
jgi:hypothetical protein